MSNKFCGCTFQIYYPICLANLNLLKDSWTENFNDREIPSKE